MKRIILLTVVLLTSFALSGCDLIPTDALPEDLIDNVSEELCREDPTNELCQIEDLSTLEETAVETLMQEAITALVAGDETACETVFSVTNTELLDECKNGTLLPEGVETFTVIDFIQAENEYIFQGFTDESTYYEVVLTVGDVDGNTRITSFAMTPIEDPTEIEDVAVTLDEFEPFFRQFITDYLDTNISDDTFQSTYFEGEKDAGFYEDRMKDQTDGTVITYVSGTILEPNVFEVVIEFDYGEASETETVEVRVNRIDMALRLSFDGEDQDCDDMDESCHPDDFLVGDEAIAFIEQYYVDYVDSTISNQDFANIYFGGYLPDTFVTEREQDLADGATFTVLNVEFFDDGSFEAEIEKANGFDKYVRKRPGRIRRRPDLLQAEWDDLIERAVEMDMNTVETFFTEFTEWYTDSSRTQKDLEQQFFANMDMTWFLENRDDDLARGLKVQVDHIEPYDEYGHFLVKVTLNDGTESRQEELIIMMSYIDEIVPVLMIVDTGGEDNDCDYIGDLCEVVTNPDIALGYMNAFLVQFNNPDTPVDQLYNVVLNFFPLLDTRDTDLAEGIVWTLEDTIEPLEENFFLFHFTAMHNENVIHRDVAARLYHNGSMVYIKSMDPGNGCTLTTSICHFMTLIEDDTILTETFQMYLRDLVDPDMTFEMISSYYFMNESPELAKKGYDYYKANSATLSHVSTVPSTMYPGFFDVTFEVTVGDTTTEETQTLSLWMIDGFLVFQFYDETNECHVDPYKCSMEDMYEHELNLINAYLEEVFVDLNDATLSDDIIQEHFGWMAPESLLRGRDNGNGGAVYVFERIIAPEDVTVDPFYEVVYTVTLPDTDPVQQSFFVQFMKTDMGLMMEVRYEEPVK